MVKESKEIKAEVNQKVVNKFIDKNSKPVMSKSLEIPIVNLKPKEGFSVGLCGSMNGQIVMENTKYKIQRIRANGTIVLKPVGKLSDQHRGI